MLKTLIIEDELYIRKGLKAMIESLNFDIVVLGECESVEEAVIVTKSTKPDLIFLDINLIGGTAFDFLKQTENIDFKVIFITAYEEYALQALKNGAVDYILKPVDIVDLEAAIEKTIELNSLIIKEQLEIVKNQLAKNQKERLILKLQEGLQIINFNDLMYCKSDKGYTTFYLSNKKSYLASKPIKEFESQLPINNFYRTHQSYIINMKFIDKYDHNGYAILKTGEKIPVASRRKDEFITKLLN